MRHARARGEIDQLVYSILHGISQYLHFLSVVISGPKSINNLFWAELRQPATDPFRLVNSDVVKNLPLLSAITEVHYVSFDTFNEAGLLVIFRLVAAAREAPQDRQVSGLAESCSQIADDVAQGFSWLRWRGLTEPSAVAPDARLKFG